MTIVTAAFQAHEQYVSSGKLSPVLLREPVFRAWERSHLQGASARRAKAIQLEPLETERLLEAEREIILAAQPYMKALSKAAGSAPHAAMLGDARAVVLDVAGDEETIHGPVSVPGPGSLLDEGACGANGIGTPLAEGAYAELVGPEHFIGGFHPFTCQGIPVHGADGKIAGTLSISVRCPEAAASLREILICSAHAIEMELLHRRLEEDLARVGASPIISDELLEKLRQDVVQSLTIGRLNVEFAARDLLRGRTEYVSRLLQLADQSLQIFARRGSLWRSLISTQPAPIQRINLNQLVVDLCGLLETERRTGAITIQTANAMEEVCIEANPRATAQALFRMLLEAFDLARGGGAVNIYVRQTLDRQGEVSFDAIPALHRLSPRQTFRYWGPLALRLYT